MRAICAEAPVQGHPFTSGFCCWGHPNCDVSRVHAGACHENSMMDLVGEQEGVLEACFVHCPSLCTSRIERVFVKLKRTATRIHLHNIEQSAVIRLECQQYLKRKPVGMTCIAFCTVIAVPTPLFALLTASYDSTVVRPFLPCAAALPLQCVCNIGPPCCVVHTFYAL